MTEVSMVGAINMAMARALEKDPRVVLLGEDIGVNGGVFRATEGLLERFGEDRVLDTPLAETVLAGMSVGLAAQGFHPVTEFQFMGFIYPALDQVVNHAGRLRNRTRGRLSCPLVFRAPMGAGIHAPEHHSESTEAMFAQIPGIRVVVPSSPTRAYGLLLSAIDDPDPVMFFEPTRLYRASKEDVEDDGHGLPLDVCFTLLEGSDVTLVTWGASVKETLAAANQLASEDISAEVIDVATLSPIDFDTILSSVEKTGRLVIVHEAPRNCGVGAEIAARVAERGLLFLQAPVERVTAPDAVVPLLRLEKTYMPGEKQIAEAARRVVRYA
jgi:2-oxoisovalerate dehydrogenase E1 component beta subunit